LNGFERYGDFSRINLSDVKRLTVLSQAMRFDEDTGLRHLHRAWLRPA